MVNIVIKIENGKQYTFTYDEAQEVHKELSKIFQNSIHLPYTPTPFEYPGTIPLKSYEITCNPVNTCSTKGGTLSYEKP